MLISYHTFFYHFCLFSQLFESKHLADPYILVCIFLKHKDILQYHDKHQEIYTDSVGLSRDLTQVSPVVVIMLFIAREKCIFGTGSNPGSSCLIF